MVFTIEGSLMCIAFVVLILLGMRALQKLRHDLWQIMDRCDKASTKAEFIEARMMKSCMRCHEFIRVFLQLVDDFNEAGDPCYLVRQFADQCTMFVEARMKRWSDMTNVVDVMHLLRYCVRTAVDRVRASEDDISMARLKNMARFELVYVTDFKSFPYAPEALMTPNVFDGSEESLTTLRTAAMNSAYGYEVYQVCDQMQLKRSFWQ